MNKLYVMCGLLGAGKTTMSKKIETAYGVKRHSYDEFPNARGNPDIDRIKKAFWEEIIKDLKQGFDVICDDANLLIEDRMYIFNKLSEHNVECEKILIIVNTPVEKCVEQNAQRVGIERVPEYQIHLTSKIMQRPTYSEGWNRILTTK